MKKIRYLLILIGVMIALIPTFLYFTQGTVYDFSFSIITTCTAIACFIGAEVVQFFQCKRNGWPSRGPLVVAIGFAVLLIYVLLHFYFQIV